NVTEFSRTLDWELRRSIYSFKEIYPELELLLKYERDFYLEGDELKAMLHFVLMLKDPQGLFIKDLEERRSFWCIREMVLIAGG
ncbi:MAG: hypothetical protein NZ992_06215, partial [Candidatus Korarchaeum sp.]|nr:hypothetical protein [Candidatus Korarchaeum sp.]MDW8035219.1 hypothetical protein [Candidatus Korarchaeum sp.]